MDNHLHVQMEAIRGQMIATALRKQTFLHREVLVLSQMLDALIVQVQSEQRANRVKKKERAERSAVSGGCPHSGGN
jgi:Spo0E like sporulation regulatory protein.